MKIEQDEDHIILTIEKRSYDMMAKYEKSYKIDIEKLIDMLIEHGVCEEN